MQGMTDAAEPDRTDCDRKPGYAKVRLPAALQQNRPGVGNNRPGLKG